MEKNRVPEVLCNLEKASDGEPAGIGDGEEFSDYTEVLALDSSPSPIQRFSVEAFSTLQKEWHSIFSM